MIEIILLIVIVILVLQIIRMKKKDVDKKKAMNFLLGVQELDGAYNYDEYNLGMWQGMENMVAKYENRKPRYKDIKQIKFIDSFKNK